MRRKHFGPGLYPSFLAAGLEIEDFFKLLYAPSERQPDLCLHRAPRRRMLRLAFVIKWTWRRSHLALHLAQIGRINRENYAGW